MARTKGSKLCPQRKYDALCALIGRQTNLTDVADRYKISSGYLSALHSRAIASVMKIAGFKNSNSINQELLMWEAPVNAKPESVITDVRAEIEECKKILAKLTAKINRLD
jgi:hypothetical protein